MEVLFQSKGGKIMNRIITISRECGSGGHTIGKMLAEKLGVPFYDKAIIELVAKKSGLAEDMVEKNGEYTTPSLLFNLSRGMFNANDKSLLPLPEQVSAYQTEVIRELAEKGPCVIVGRGADYILRKREDCFNVFIHGSTEDKVKRVVSEHNIPENEAEKHIVSRDKKRAKNYIYLTDRNWGDARNYNLSLDSSYFGIEKCVEIILNYCNI